VKILFLCHRIPYPPNKGEKIRAFYQLRAIAERHEVDVFTLMDDARDLVHQRVLEKYCRRLTVARIRPMLSRLRALPFLLTRNPLTIPYFYSAQLQAEVRKALAQESYDRIFVYSSSMAQYVESVEGIPIVMDLVDVDSNKWKQYAAFTRFPFSAVYLREGRLLQEYERRICERSACVVVTTEREAQLVRQISHEINVHVISMGVDTARFSQSPHACDTSTPTVIFTGDMSYFPNEEAVTYFARQVLPRVRGSVPGARFLIVGRNPSKKVQTLRKIPGVEVTGSVPDVGVYLAQAHVAVAPLSIAAGIQTKILEAMAYGLPVVATPCTVQALAPEVADVVEIGSTPEELAQRIAKLLTNPRAATERGVECRRRVEASYTWDEALRRLLQLIEEPAAPISPPERRTSLPSR
jgi:sugar transferase (PEP-CTERM/EpsH1 system associated)